jgi:hypothetical protein
VNGLRVSQKESVEKKIPQFFGMTLGGSGMTLGGSGMNLGKIQVDIGKGSGWVVKKRPPRVE